MTENNSIGGMGRESRRDEREYWNYPELVTGDNVDTFEDDTNWHLASVENNRAPGSTRAVMRAVVDRAALDHLLASRLVERIEVVAPLPTGEYMVYAAHNRTERGEGMAAAQQDRTRTRRTNTQNSATPVSELRFVDQVPDTVQLEQLWDPTFDGWDREECERLAARITAEQGIEPSRRTVWFGGLMDGDQLVAAATVERLDMPSRLGTIALLESTEWAALPSRRREGLIPRVVAELARVVATHMETVPHLQFAECNLRSGAHIAAERAGFTVPQAHGLQQILVDNVRVNDGFEPANGYRSFLLLTVPQETAR